MNQGAFRTTPVLLTFRQFADRHIAFPESSLRWMRFNQETNGFEPAFVSVQRRVLIDEGKFFQIIVEKNGRSGTQEP